MTDAVKYEDLKAEADRLFTAFEQEFKPFERFAIDRFLTESLPNLFQQLHVEGYSLAEAKKRLSDLAVLKTKFLGKKSEWATAKKQIGKISDGFQRASAGQLLLLREVSMTDRLEN